MPVHSVPVWNQTDCLACVLQNHCTYILLTYCVLSTSEEKHCTTFTWWRNVTAYRRFRFYSQNIQIYSSRQLNAIERPAFVWYLVSPTLLSFLWAKCSEQIQDALLLWRVDMEEEKPALYQHFFFSQLLLCGPLVLFIFIHIQHCPNSKFIGYPAIHPPSVK